MHPELKETKELSPQEAMPDNTFAQTFYSPQDTSNTRDETGQTAQSCRLVTCDNVYFDAVRGPEVSWTPLQEYEHNRRTIPDEWLPYLQPLEPINTGFSCHSYTFNRRDVWIGSDATASILHSSGFQQIDVSKAKAGDVVVYLKGNELMHTGRVSQVWGERVYVASKFGLGAVYQHPLQGVPRSYGDRQLVFRQTKPDILKEISHNTVPTGSQSLRSLIDQANEAARGSS